MLALPLVFASPLKNLVVHHNPAYPVALHVAGHALPFAEEPYDSSPPYLEHTPRPWRWVVSLAEVGIQPLEESRRWTIDQYMPPDSRGNRMGGFFGAYVAVNLLALALLAWRARHRAELRPQARAVVGGVLVLSLVCSLMPQSHELRYYLVWMLVLVLANVGLSRSSRGAGGLRLELGAALVATASSAVVVASTRGWHVLPQRLSVRGAGSRPRGPGAPRRGARGSVDLRGAAALDRALRRAVPPAAALRGARGRGAGRLPRRAACAAAVNAVARARTLTT